MSTEDQPQTPPRGEPLDAGLPAQPDPLRDKFALAAMQKILGSEAAMERVGEQAKKRSLAPFAIVARMSYRMANEMMKERAK